MNQVERTLKEGFHVFLCLFIYLFALWLNCEIFFKKDQTN